MHLKIKLISFLTLFFALTLQAQFRINGIVTGNNHKALPFATITTTDNQNTITDVDGKFELITKSQPTSIFISYIGYNSQKINILAYKKFYQVVLIQKVSPLQEIIVSTYNPTTALIRAVINNKSTNNPQTRFNGFEYKSYNKLLVSAHADSIDGHIDTTAVYKNFQKKPIHIDSSDFKFKEIINKQHLFQTEKVSQYQFANHHLKENILGTKMAGLKEPIYELIAFNLQSNSVYDAKYELLETTYNSPIAFDALKQYNYKLLDTVSIEDRKTYMVYFKNKRKSRATGLEGVLYIDPTNYAIAKAIMRIRGVLDITGVHEFKYYDQEKIWFPTSTTFKIVKGKNKEDIKILGGTIQFDGAAEDAIETRKKSASDFTFLESKTQLFDINFSIVPKIKLPSIYIDIKDDASKKSEEFWNSYRTDTLDAKSKYTYIAIDSLSIKKRIESRLRFGRKIINGYVPAGPIDIDLKKLFSYNNYEGFRLGFGAVTNETFSKFYRIEGYTAYGTKDGNFKYNIGAGLLADKKTNTWVNLSYTDDVREIASTLFETDKRVFKLYDPRPINISTFYQYKAWKANVQSKVIPKTEAIFEFSRNEIESKFDYHFNLDGNLFNRYVMTSAMISIAWSPFSDFMQTPTGRNESEKRYPKFSFQYLQTLPNTLGNDFTFSKIDVKAEYEKKYLNRQKTSVLFQAGLALGDVPLTHLYNTGPNNLTKETIIQRITFSGRNSFETMYFNEFFSSEYAFFQIKHTLDRIKIMRKVRPSLTFVTRMAWGNLHHPEQHIGPTYKTLDKGFFESGIELNKIYKGFGLGGFYRYGPNQLLKFEDNIALKLSYTLDLGL